MCYKPVEIKIEKPMDNGYTHYMLVPCRQCLECRQQRANEWALRCMFEAEEHLQNCFITLTYEKNPFVLVKEDLQKFIKRLRKHIAPTKIKYFACGEYGEKHMRPHFHVIIFGYDFEDKYESSKSEKGYSIYDSETLHKLWGKGLVTVQDVTVNSCAYCALYSAKPRSQLPVYLRKNPEFNVMSQSLGIKGMAEHFDEYVKTDEIWFDGKSYNIPQALLNKLCKDKNGRVVLDVYHEIKNKRMEKLKGKDQERWEFLGLGNCMYEQKKYISENREKRLTKNI